LSYSKREIRSTLISKFHFEEVDGSSHEAIAFFDNEKKVATTRFSRGRGGRDIGDALMFEIAKQIRVSTLNFFKRMIDCTRSHEDFIKRLKEGGYI
jgi:hypothetical protein